MFSFFRHAVKQQNRESTNVCCISLLLMILPPSVLYFFVIWVCIFLGVFLVITETTGCSQQSTTQRNVFLKEFGDFLPLPVLLRELSVGVGSAWISIISQARRSC
jgi:hypothetical protein